MSEDITKLKSFKVTIQGFDMKTTLPTLSEVVDITANMAYDGNFITNHIWDYNDFLKQPLKLEMFIPCKDGVPLEEPEKYYGQGYNELFKEYQQALDRVIFKGFEVQPSINGIILLSHAKGNLMIHKSGVISFNLDWIKTISDLCNQVDLVDKKYNELKLR